MQYLRLSCTALWVDARVSDMNGWLASADTPDRPSIGLGWTPRQALTRALEPFDALIEDLLVTAPSELLEHGAMG